MSPDLQAWIAKHFPYHGGKTAAAKALGIHPRTLRRKLSGEISITKRDEQLMAATDREQSTLNLGEEQ